MTQKQQDTASNLIRISGVDVKKCMKCGKCSGACPSYDEMEYHPHQFVSLVERGRVDELVTSGSLYKCLSCFTCSERCPRGVDPAKIIEAVRLTAVRQKGGNYMKPEDIPPLIDGDLPQQAVTSAFRKFVK